MINRMNNDGFFNATASFEVVTQEDKPTAQVNYTATPGRVYLYSEINFPQARHAD